MSTFGFDFKDIHLNEYKSPEYNEQIAIEIENSYRTHIDELQKLLDTYYGKFLIEYSQCKKMEELIEDKYILLKYFKKLTDEEAIHAKHIGIFSKTEEEFNKEIRELHHSKDKSYFLWNFYLRMAKKYKNMCEEIMNESLIPREPFT